MSNPLHVTGIAHLGIRVHDLDRALGFYRHLGFELTMGPVGPEPVAILHSPSGVEINLILNADQAAERNPLMDVQEKLPGYTHAALLVSDVDAVVAALKSAGIAISGGPVEFPGGARAVFVRDPDRNVIELHQRAPA